MLEKKVILIALLLIGFGLKELNAQQAIPAAGGTASGAGGSINYSIGQVINTTNTGTNGSVAQGVQQPYEISVISGIQDALDIILQCAIFPNPTTSFLTLKFDASDLSNVKFMSYQIFDITGNLLENKKVENLEEHIDMSKFSSAIYFLRVIQANKVVKTFKIIKN